MVFILDNLAIGSLADAQNLPSEITAILNVAEEINIEFKDRLYFKVPVKDFSAISPEQLKQAVDWIDSHITQHKILVFCNAGIGRSTSVIVGYLVLVKGFSFGQAIEFIARKKPDISILPGLIETIRKLTNKV
ncbi:MAG: dual specificity protein phosphatase family protein [Candidatus Omnitrophica bacterium]|nr:dual specificity protein phosphatase family protein [Candidatus Omnitrophota bacterium]